MTELAPVVVGMTDVASDAALIAADRAEREDLIAEGFTRVLRILRSGAGPDGDFRPYLLTTIRNTMISRRRRDSAVSVVAEVPDVAPGAGSDEPVGDRMLANVAAEAFASLPERWRSVLWRTEIVGQSPAKIAEDLGMTPNAVAALACRAREGLRQAYLDQHVPEARRRGCKNISGQLARWVRDDISDLKAHRIAGHLDRCARCRKLAAGLRELNEELSGSVAPLILGVPVVTHWLTTTGSFASSGAGTGASVLSWATAAKVAAAGALVTTVTIGASTSGEAPSPLSGGGGTMTRPVQTGPAEPGTGAQAAPAGTAEVTPGPPDPQLMSVPGVPAGEPAAEGASGAAPDTGTPPEDKQAAKESKQAAKESRQAAKESKQAAKESKQAAKESKKADKASETKDPTG